MHRRAVLRNGLALGGTAVASAILGVGGPVSAAPASSSSPAPGPYGSLEGRRPDGNGLVLPEGFSSRIVAVGGTGVGATDYTWPLFPDGKGTVATPDGGWILACNHEVFDFQTIGESAGGASSIRFDSDGS
ncbi:MAG TPA: translocation protein TolB, partial [Acidimicrobiaceae bacterium]|nr:translocation protein TolB [Acidimicrobiaceae bacterium]